MTVEDDFNAFLTALPASGALAGKWVSKAAVTASSDNQQISLKPVSAVGVIGTTIATANTDISASGGTGDEDEACCAYGAEQAGLKAVI